ncbi:MAG: hypothetical protein NC120_06155 [Ruminococcus sp.]|nr:hypothetical protein [Ruminococcus sp.]
MGKYSSDGVKKIRPALTPEARESQMISLAMDLAEKQLLDGTASPLVISHYLKLGSTKGDQEIKKLQRENELLRAKTESLESAKRCEELYENALAAIQKYSGNGE